MTILAAVLLDLAAIAVLVLGIFAPKHQRRDLIVSYFVVNVGVLAVSIALTTTSVSAGLGLGLFGVLSIIRLRSLELNQTEVAYYFASLALGLIAGLGSSLLITAALMAALVGIIAVVDSQFVLGSTYTQLIVVDRAIDHPDVLKAHLSERLGAEVLRASVQRIDWVNDTTWVEVTCRANTVQTSADDRTARVQGLAR